MFSEKIFEDMSAWSTYSLAALRLLLLINLVIHVSREITVICIKKVKGNIRIKLRVC